MTIAEPLTCYCKLFIDDTDGNNKRKMKFIKQCKLHTTIQQVFDYNNLSRNTTGTIEDIIREQKKSKEASR